MNSMIKCGFRNSLCAYDDKLNWLTVFAVDDVFLDKLMSKTLQPVVVKHAAQGPREIKRVTHRTSVLCSGYLSLACRPVLSRGLGKNSSEMETGNYCSFTIFEKQNLWAVKNSFWFHDLEKIEYFQLVREGESLLKKLTF